VISGGATRRGTRNRRSATRQLLFLHAHPSYLPAPHRVPERRRLAARRAFQWASASAIGYCRRRSQLCQRRAPLETISRSPIRGIQPRLRPIPPGRPRRKRRPVRSRPPLASIIQDTRQPNPGDESELPGCDTPAQCGAASPRCNGLRMLSADGPPTTPTAACLPASPSHPPPSSPIRGIA
jgi:hypothetical protein